jgi:glucosamine-6-phosphate deaminase
MGAACGRSSSCIIPQPSPRNAVGVTGERSQEMVLKVFNDKNSLANAAAQKAAAAIHGAIRDRGQARVIAATGTSQFEFLAALTESADVDWGRVEVFHLDEYIGLPATHPASFRKILLERLVNKTGIAKFHPLDGDARDVSEVIRQVGEALASVAVDIAFVGIGENGHLAFNDPPADFETEEPYLIVNLDEACRRQQVGEGWFGDISEVPRQAISMSIRQILKAKEILAVVPDSRKAQAVKACFEGEVSPMAPASILRTHANTNVYLDKESASLLSSVLETSA